MIKSMTGFGRNEYSDGKRNIIVEIKSVNHRYSDIMIKLPRRYAFAEDRVKALVRNTAKRGKVEVSIIVENLTQDDTNIKLNTPLARQYYDRLMELKDSFQLPGEVTLEFLSSLPDVMKVIPDVENEEEVTASLLIPVSHALLKFDEMRCREGMKLAEDLLMRNEILQKHIAKIEQYSQAITLAYKEKLQERIKDLLKGNVEIPEERLATEAAIFADKSNITEELVRLDSHIHQVKNIIENSQEADGKKLDFIVQEMNREANTCGSKAAGIAITNIAVEMKSEIEKIREQVQNIE